jgi:hypothetical protein
MGEAMPSTLDGRGRIVPERGHDRTRPIPAPIPWRFHGSRMRNSRNWILFSSGLSPLVDCSNGVYEHVKVDLRPAIRRETLIGLRRCSRLFDDRKQGEACRASIVDKGMGEAMPSTLDDRGRIVPERGHD